MQRNGQMQITSMLAPLFAQKHLFIQLLSSTPALAPLFASSPDPKNPQRQIYVEQAADTMPIRQIKALLNAMNTLESMPKFIETLQNFIQNKQGKLSMLWDNSKFINELADIEYYVKAFMYYGLQTGTELVNTMPNLHMMTADVISLVKNFSIIDNVFKVVMNRIFTHIDNQPNVDLPNLMVSISQVQNPEQFYQLAKDNIVAYAEDFFQLLQASPMIDAHPKSKLDSDKVKATLIAWFFKLEKLREVYGFEAAIVENKFKALALPLFAAQYPCWQIALAEHNLSQLQSRVQELQNLTLIDIEQLKYNTPLVEVLQFRQKLKAIQSFDVKLLRDQIDRSIHKRTNMHKLNKLIAKLEGEISLALYQKNHSDVGHPASVKKNSEKMHALILQKAAELNTLKSYQVQIKKNIKALTTGQSNQVHYFDQARGVLIGESKHTNNDAILKKTHVVYTKAAAALNMQLDKTLQDTRQGAQRLQALRKDHLPLVQRDAVNVHPAAEERAIAEFKQMIMDQSARKDPLSLSQFVAKVRGQVAPASVASQASIVEIENNLSFTEPAFIPLVKSQLMQLTLLLNAKENAALFENRAGDPKVLSKLQADNSPIVTLIKSIHKALDRMGAFTLKAQLYATHVKIGNKPTAAMLMSEMLSLSQSSFKHLSAALGCLDELKTIVSASPTGKLLQQPLIQHVENIFQPLQMFHSQWQLLDSKSFSSIAKQVLQLPMSMLDPLMSLKSQLENIIQPANPLTPGAAQFMLQAQKTLMTLVRLVESPTSINALTFIVAAKKLNHLLPNQVNDAQFKQAVTDTLTQLTKTFITNTENIFHAVGNITLEKTSALKQAIEGAVKTNFDLFKHHLSDVQQLERQLGMRLIASEYLLTSLEHAKVPAQALQNMSHTVLQKLPALQNNASPMQIDLPVAPAPALGGWVSPDYSAALHARSHPHLSENKIDVNKEKGKDEVKENPAESKEEIEERLLAEEVEAFDLDLEHMLAQEYAIQQQLQSMVQLGRYQDFSEQLSVNIMPAGSVQPNEHAAMLAERTSIKLRS